MAAKAVGSRWAIVGLLCAAMAVQAAALSTSSDLEVQGKSSFPGKNFLSKIKQALGRGKDASDKPSSAKPKGHDLNMLLGGVCPHLAGGSKCSKQLGKEYFKDDWRKEEPDLKKVLLFIMKANKKEYGYSPRAAHATGYGCAKGVFQIDKDVPKHLRVGLFRHLGHRFTTFLRWSGNKGDAQQDDHELGSRGLAIKVLLGKESADDPRLLEHHTQEQDFLLIGPEDHFIIQRPEEFALASRLTGLGRKLGTKLKALGNVLLRPHMTKALLSKVKQTRARENVDLLSMSFHSGLPSKLGEGRAVKFALRPCKERLHKSSKPPKADTSFYAQTLAERLRAEGGCYDFFVQEQEDACREQVDDSITRWTTPWQRVATLLLPAQEVESNTPDSRCERRVFNPWFGLRAHQPLGMFNRMRKDAYNFSAVTRLRLNGLQEHVDSKDTALESAPYEEGSVHLVDVDARLKIQKLHAGHLAAALDRASITEVVAFQKSIGRKRFAALFEMGRPAKLADFEELLTSPPMTTVTGFGRNNLPVSRDFLKVFYRYQAGGSSRNGTKSVIYGFNVNPKPLEKAVGGGYFRVEEGANGGPAIFNYHAEPPAYPAGAPKYKDNSGAVAGLVFGIQDTMRRLSKRTFIGRVNKATVQKNGEKKLGSMFVDMYFLLTLAKAGELEATEWALTLKTGNSWSAGTDHTVHVQFVGAKGDRSKWMTLDKSLYNDRKRGTEDTYLLTTERVTSRVAAVRIKLKPTVPIKGALFRDSWHLLWLKLRPKYDAPGSSNEQLFPAHAWIAPFSDRKRKRGATTRIFFSADAIQLFPPFGFGAGPALMKLRDQEMRRQREAYKLTARSTTGGPLHWDDAYPLPLDERDHDKESVRSKLRVLTLLMEKWKGIGSELKQKLKFWDSSKPWDTVKWFEDQTKTMASKGRVQDQVNLVTQRWLSDDEFGAQTLRGTHTVKIERCVTVPLQVDDDARLDPDAPQLRVSSNGDSDSDASRAAMLSQQTDTAGKNSRKPVLLEKDSGGNGRARRFTAYLEKARRERRLFMLDYRNAYKGRVEFPNKKGRSRYVAPALALFEFHPDTGKLLPIAIELTRGGPVFTPPRAGPQGPHRKDVKWTWQLAKTFVANMDSVYHEAVSHFLETHGILEPIVISTMRHLPPHHPVYHLLRPHTRRTLRVNKLAREKLLPPGKGIITKLVSPGDHFTELLGARWKEWSFVDQAPDRRLQQRHIGNNDLRTTNGKDVYGYRAYGRMLFRIIKKYVSEMVDLWYTDDAVVRADTELQRWARLTSVEGLPGHTTTRSKLVGKSAGTAEIPRFPTSFKTKKALVHAVSTFIWVASPQHASQNFAQFTYYGFVPSRPMSLFRSPPTSLRSLTEKEFCQWLPSPKRVRDQMAIVYVLSTIEGNVLLGETKGTIFFSRKEMDVFRKFKHRLQRIEHRMRQSDRKKGANAPKYVYLQPRFLPTSTSI